MAVVKANINRVALSSTVTLFGAWLDVTGTVEKVLCISGMPAAAGTTSVKVYAFGGGTKPGVTDVGVQVGTAGGYLVDTVLDLQTLMRSLPYLRVELAVQTVATARLVQFSARESRCY
mgnify:CR=1 FL=1